MSNIFSKAAGAFSAFFKSFLKSGKSERSAKTTARKIAKSSAEEFVRAPKRFYELNPEIKPSAKRYVLKGARIQKGMLTISERQFVNKRNAETYEEPMSRETYAKKKAAREIIAVTRADRKRYPGEPTAYIRNYKDFLAAKRRGEQPDDEKYGAAKDFAKRHAHTERQAIENFFSSPKPERKSGGLPGQTRTNATGRTVYRRAA